MNMAQAGQMNPNQTQSRAQNQFAQMAQNMVGPGHPSMQQQGIPGAGNPQQVQTPRGIGQNNQAQAQAVMDSMDLPPHVINQLHNQLPPDVKKWRDLKVWIASNNHNLPVNVQRQLGAIQHRQFQVMMQRRAQPQEWPKHEYE